MFSGEHLTTIDAKGRTSIPVRMREVLLESFGDERFVLTKCPVDLGSGLVSRGLSLYPLSEWRGLLERLDQKGGGFTGTQLNSIKRLIVAPGVECCADKQGRVLIPPSLRDYADLERDIVFVGMRTKVEVWSQESWQNVCRQAEKDFPADTAALADLGL